MQSCLLNLTSHTPFSSPEILGCSRQAPVAGAGARFPSSWYQNVFEANQRPINWVMRMIKSQ